jgi:hypothetical protein
MMSELGDTTNLEKTSLEAHVDLCAMRYRQLDLRLTGLEVKMDVIQKDILEGQKSLKTTIIGAAATLASSMMAIVITVLMKF